MMLEVNPIQDIAIEAKGAIPDPCNIPTRVVHEDRGLYNIIPTGLLVYLRDHPTKHGWEIYVDEEDREWVKLPWYLNIFHKPWANSKFVHYDANVLEGGLGSSEVQMNRSGQITNEGSYNYRDLYITSHWRHFKADILPNVIYL